MCQSYKLLHNFSVNISPLRVSLQHPGFSDSLRPDDVNPRLIFHYGVPSGSVLLAFDSIQQILAISTK